MKIERRIQYLLLKIVLYVVLTSRRQACDQIFHFKKTYDDTNFPEDLNEISSFVEIIAFYIFNYL